MKRIQNEVQKLGYKHLLRWAAMSICSGFLAGIFIGFIANL